MWMTRARAAALLGAAAALLVVSQADAKPQKKAPRPKKVLVLTPPKPSVRQPKRLPAPAREARETDDETTPTSPPNPTRTVTEAADSNEPKTEPKEETPVNATPEPTPSPASPSPAGAPEGIDEPSEKKLELGGRIFTHFRSSFDFDEPLQQVSTSVWLDMHARMTKGTFAAASVAGDLLTPNIDGKVEGRARLREGYAGAHGAGFEVRIGQQILSWGNADVVHAVDFLTAQDYTFFSANADAKQIGAPSVVLSYSPNDGTSPFKMTAVWQPAFPATKVLIPKGKVPVGVTILDEERPKLSMLNSEAAVKIGWAPGGWDIAVIGFHGWNHIAEPYVVEAKQTPEGPSATIGRRFNQINAVGLQASVALDSWVLRFEGAYVATQNMDGRNRLIQPSHIDAIAGIERPFGERVRASLQGIVRVHPYWMSLDAPYVTRAKTPEQFVEAGAQEGAARLNAQVQNYTHQIRPGASLALNYASEDEALEIGVAGIAYFVGFDWAVQPSIGYRFFDALKIEVGAQIFGGKQNSLGFLNKQSGFFAQATYAF